MGQCKEFSGFGNATKCLASQQIDFNAETTCIQSEGIADDLGFIHKQMIFITGFVSNLFGIKKLFFRYVTRHFMNINVNRIRKNGIKLF